MIQLSMPMSLRTLFERDRTFQQPVNWGVTAFMIALHLCALGAIFFFTWKALLLAVFMWWVAGSLGIGMGYHRLLTHRGYKTPKLIEYFFTACGTLAIRGPYFLGCHPSHASPKYRQGRRSSFPARRRTLGSHGLDHYRARHAPGSQRTSSLRPRSTKR